jgi:hypothetical protein
MRGVLSLILIGCLCATSFGQALSGPPEVDTAAVIRRGDHVEHVNGIRSAEDEAFGDITAPPADDSHKWFITILTSPNCGPCNKLKEDWAQSPYLKAFGVIGDQKASWSHLNIYNAEDATHQWFQKNIEIKGYPTILIQPPRSKQYGAPETIVMQKTGYNGKPEELAKQITSSLRTYVATLSKRNALANTTPSRERPANGGHQQCLPSSTPPVVSTAPPFVVTPVAPLVPGPQPTPAPPLDIPNPVDPDAQKPVAPPATPDQAKLADTLSVVVDPETFWSSDEKRAGLKKLIHNLKAQYPTLTPRVISPDQAKLEFPTLDTSKSQVILTSGGKLLGQIPQAILDELLKDQPELQTAARILTALGAVWPAAQFGLVALAGFVIFREWRKRRTAAQPTNPGTPSTEPKLGEGLIMKRLEELLNKVMPAEPTPKS